jgi:hypothetical protein
MVSQYEMSVGNSVLNCDTENCPDIVKGPLVETSGDVWSE